MLSTDPEDWNPLGGSVESKINATTKLVVIGALVLSIKKQNNKIFLRTVIVLGLVMLLYVAVTTQQTSTSADFTQNDEQRPSCAVMSTENPLGNWLPPATASGSGSGARLGVPEASVDAVLSQGVPTDSLSGNGNLTRPFYKTPEDNDRFKELMYGDSFENTFKQGAVYSHLACPHSMGPAGASHGFSSTA